MRGRGLNLCGSGRKHVAGFCERGNELSGFIKCGEVCDCLRTQLVTNFVTI